MRDARRDALRDVLRDALRDALLDALREFTLISRVLDPNIYAGKGPDGFFRGQIDQNYLFVILIQLIIDIKYFLTDVF